MYFIKQGKEKDLTQRSLKKSAEVAEKSNPRAQPGIIPQTARDGAAVAVPRVLYQPTG